MATALKVLIADDDDSVREYLDEALTKLGYQVVASCSDGLELVQQFSRTHPELIITDVMMPGIDGLEAVRRINEEVIVPVILITGFHDSDLIRRAVELHVLGYLVKPIAVADLQAAIEIVFNRFKEFQALRKEATTLRHALDERKIIERAKGLLMKQSRIDEAEAFQRLQRTARSSRKRIADVAQMIIISSEAMKPAE